VRTLFLKLLSAGSDGMSTQAPVTSNFQPWYTQRRPSSSLRPKNIEAPRCGQAFGITPTAPDVVRNAMRFSPRRRMRIGEQSGEGSSLDIIAGIQYSRRTLPIGVPGPVCVTRSLSDFVSISVQPPVWVGFALPFYCFLKGAFVWSSQ